MGIDFMGRFPPSLNTIYILMVVDYVSKWVEAIASTMNDSKVVLKFLKKNIFTRFGTPRALLSDNGTHFCNKSFELLLKKYRIFHKITTPYHPQASMYGKNLSFTSDVVMGFIGGACLKTRSAVSCTLAMLQPMVATLDQIK